MSLRSFLVVLFLLLPTPLFAQTATQSAATSSSTQTTSSTSTSTPAATSPSNSTTTGGASGSVTPPGGSGQSTKSTKNEPVPYSPDEFPGWVNDLRRAEIITIGAFPISLLVTSLSYQLYRYVQNGFSQAYAPALLGSGTNPLSNQERIGVIISGIGVSMVIALVDYGLGKAEKKK